ncbi:hypothetical protein [Endozoicomonas sp. GU-1]|uniref:hypothetical protein n=1 Tax=Endozoicomonas sp. GU-1 TaxID=3009078 RepID=UPI0022B4DDF5|nr:hypothetical protein [Endozoicomonas sp. GU-1]WBA79985.1 hypothetical protein O2T12_16670 [Endozoicomonas sp. GU-1]WBA87558.1 hypothetical protein O3276_05895 [Endozoicomonas sp. GU-1]
MDSQRISPPSYNQIKLPDQKPARYVGIESGKDSKILDSHGKLVSKWGRKIENYLKIERINPEKYARSQKMHKFQESMTSRRVKLLTQEVQNTSDHIDSILMLPNEIPNDCEFISQKKFQKLVQSDVKRYLSYEIKSCNSGEKLLKLYEEVQRLGDHHRLPPKITDPLIKKIKDQMAILVEEMPNHLRSIDPGIEDTHTLELTKQKCEVVKGLYKAAKKIDYDLCKKHRKALRDMMVDIFTEDVEKVATLCKARNNLKENKYLSDQIIEVRNSIIYPFLEEADTKYNKYVNKVKKSTDIQIKDLEEQREIIPKIITRLNQKLTTASQIIKNEAKATAVNENLLDGKRKPTKSTIQKIEEREVNKFNEFKRLQNEYKSLYETLNSRLKQFDSSVEIYFKDQQNLTPEALTHPEAFLTAYRGVELTKPWESLQSLDPTDTNSNLALQSFNHACIDSHFKELMSEEQGWLPEKEIKKLKNNVQGSVTENSDQKEAYDQLVVVHTACELASNAYQKATKDETKSAKRYRRQAQIVQGTVTSQQLDTAKQLRMLHAKPVTNKTDHISVDAKPDAEMDESNNHSLSSSSADSSNKAPAVSDAEVPQDSIDANITSGLHQESATEKPQTLQAKKVLPPINGKGSTTENSDAKIQPNGNKLPPIPPRPEEQTPPERPKLPTSNRPTWPAPKPPSSENRTSGGAKGQTDGSKSVPTPPPPPPVGRSKPPQPPLPKAYNKNKDQTDGGQKPATPPPPPPAPPVPSAGGQTKKGSSDVKAQERRNALLSDIRSGANLKKLPENLKNDRSAVKFNDVEGRNQDKASGLEKGNISAASSTQPDEESKGVDITGALKKVFKDKGFLTEALEKRRERFKPDDE